METHTESEEVKGRIVILGSAELSPDEISNLRERNLVNEIVLLDESSDRSIELLNCLGNMIGISVRTHVRPGEFSDLDNADIAVLAGPGATEPLETNDQALANRFSLVRDAARRIATSKFKGVLIVISQPAEVMAKAAQKASGMEKRRIVGISSSELLKGTAGSIAPKPNLWCSGNPEKTDFWDFCSPECRIFQSMGHLEPVTIGHGENTRSNFSSSIAVCVARLCEAIIRDEHTIIPVVANFDGHFGLDDGWGTVPCIIGRAGVEGIVDFPIEEEELQRLRLASVESRRLFDTFAEIPKNAAKVHA